jgi:hypothetical protein
MSDELEAIDRAVRHKLEELELRVDAIQGGLDVTQDKFTRNAVKSSDQIHKELGIQQDRIIAVAKRLTEIEIELGMAVPLKRLDTRHWMQSIKYNAPVEPTELEEEEILNAD